MRASEALATVVSPQALTADFPGSALLCSPTAGRLPASRELARGLSFPREEGDGAGGGSIATGCSPPPARPREHHPRVGSGVWSGARKAAAAGEVRPVEPAWAESASPTWTYRGSLGLGVRLSGGEGAGRSSWRDRRSLVADLWGPQLPAPTADTTVSACKGLGVSRDVTLRVRTPGVTRLRRWGGELLKTGWRRRFGAFTGWVGGSQRQHGVGRAPPAFCGLVTRPRGP